MPQVSGEGGSGKSLLLQHLLCRCLLPQEWYGLPLGGCGAGAVLVDTDLRFNVLQLSLMMELLVKRRINAAKRRRNGDDNGAERRRNDNDNGAERRRNDNDNSNDNDDASQAFQKRIGGSVNTDADSCCKKKSTFREVVGNKNKSLQYITSRSKKEIKILVKDLIKITLERFVYLKCYHSRQFVATLLSLDQLLVSRPLVSMICVDSLSGYYWYDRSYMTGTTWARTEEHYNTILRHVLDVTHKCGVTVFGVKQSLFSKPKQHQHHVTAGTVVAADEEVEGGIPSCFEEYNYLGKVWHGALSYSIVVREREVLSSTAPYPEGAKPPRRVYSVTVEGPAASTTAPTTAPSTSTAHAACRHTKVLLATYHEDGLRWCKQ